MTIDAQAVLVQCRHHRVTSRLSTDGDRGGTQLDGTQPVHQSSLDLAATRSTRTVLPGGDLLGDLEALRSLHGAFRGQWCSRADDGTGLAAPRGAGDVGHREPLRTRQR